MTRLVLDANAHVSGIAGIRTGSPPARLIRGLQAMRFEVVACPTLLEEVRRALRNPYFRERVDAIDAARAVARVAEVAILLEDPPAIDPTLRDPADDYLLTLAREAGAELIVSGDRDLLDHAGELGPPAMSPRAACEMLGLDD